ncbi:MAG: VOC family protein [Anaerolineae bacterium]
MLRMDHIVIAVGYDIEQAMGHFRALGFTVVYGGVHASGATHNALILVSRSAFIELLALTGNDAKSGVVDFAPMVRQSMVPGHNAFVGYALRSDDLDADSAALRARGDQVSEPMESGRLRPDGVRLAWKNALVNESYAPFLIQYLSPPDAQRLPADPLAIKHRNGVTSLCAVDIAAQRVTLQAANPVVFDATHTFGIQFEITDSCM